MATLTRPMVEVAGNGRAVFGSMLIRGVTNSAWTAPMILQTSGALAIHALDIHGIGTGSGTAVAITTDNAGNVVQNGNFAGWGYSVPSGFFSGVYGPNSAPSFTFTPTVTFATPGDVAPTYTVQTGRYWYTANGIEGVLQVSASMNAYTTAAGNLRILTGLPSTASGALASSSLATWGRVTLTSGYTQLSSIVGAGEIQLRMSGSGLNAANVTTANVPANTAGFNVTTRFTIPAR